jgi:hypothetical protein
MKAGLPPTQVFEQMPGVVEGAGVGVGGGGGGGGGDRVGGGDATDPEE